MTLTTYSVWQIQLRIDQLVEGCLRLISSQQMGTVTDFRRLAHTGNKAVAEAKIVDSPHLFSSDAMNCAPTTLKREMLKPIRRGAIRRVRPPFVTAFTK